MSPSLRNLLADFADGMARIEQRRRLIDALASDIGVKSMGLKEMPEDISKRDVELVRMNINGFIIIVSDWMDAAIKLMIAELDRVRQARKEQEG